MTSKQCTINYNADERRAMLLPNADDPIKYSVMHNGERLEGEPKRLEHGDRILVGSHHYYIYVDPQIDADPEYDYDGAVKEANKDRMAGLDGGDGEEFEAKLKELEEKIAKEKAAKE